MAFRRRPMMGARRKRSHNYFWVGAKNDGFTGLAANTVSNPIPLAVPTTAGYDVIIRRIRGMLQIAPTAADGSGTFWGEAGIIVLDGRQLTSAASPRPFEEATDTWLWYQVFCGRNVPVGVPTTVFQSERSYVTDSKALRKMNADEYLALIVSNESDVSIDFHYGMRTLLSMKGT